MSVDQRFDAVTETIQRVLHAAIAADDIGYADPRGLGEAFAPWARRLWGWDVRPSDVRVAPDVACHEVPRTILDRLPAELPYRAGYLGVLAARAAFTEGGPWLAETMAILDRNRTLLVELLAAELPETRYVPPAAGYLAWLAGLGDDPARKLLYHANVALSSGPSVRDGRDGLRPTELGDDAHRPRGGDPPDRPVRGEVRAHPCFA